jgi:hypothetical protein
MRSIVAFFGLWIPPRNRAIPHTSAAGERRTAPLRSPSREATIGVQGLAAFADLTSFAETAADLPVWICGVLLNDRVALELEIVPQAVANPHLAEGDLAACKKVIGKLGDLAPRG